MAVAWQATGGSVSASTGTLTPTWPASVAVGDIGICFIESQANAASLTTANGFTRLGSTVSATGTRLDVFWCRAASTTPANPVFAANTDHQFGTIQTYRGAASTGDPFTTYAAAVKSTASTTDLAPAVSTIHANQLIVIGITKDLDATAAFATAPATNANLSSISERFDAGTTSGNGGGVAVIEGVKATPGNTGTTSVTVTSSASAMMTIALTEVVEAAPTTVLNNPADASSDSDTTPVLDFTGTDANADSIEYNVQIDSVNTFNSQSLAQPVDSYSDSNSDGLLSLNNTNFAVAQSFTGDGRTLNNTKLYLLKSNAPTGNAVVNIYKHSGVYGSGSLPEGSPLATSNNLDVSTLTTSAAEYSITFSGGNQIVLTDGVKYVFAIEYTAGTSSAFVRVRCDTSSPTHSGNASTKSSTGYWALSGNDLAFIVEATANASLPLLSVRSEVDAGFANPDSPGDTHPFNSGENIQYTVQSALDAETYYWRARGTDPTGSASYGAWSSTRSFTITGGGGGATDPSAFFAVL